VSEARADAVQAGRGEALDLAPEKRIRHLDEDPRAVARVLVGPGRPAVLEVGERDERPLDRLVARNRVEARDEGDAARVVLERGVVQTGWTVRQRQLRVRRRGSALGASRRRRERDAD